MTNTAKDKQVNSRLFYGKFSKVSKNRSLGNRLYFTPMERKALRERKELLKAEAELSILEDLKNDTFTKLDKFEEKILTENKDIEKNDVSENNTPEETCQTFFNSPSKYFPMFCKKPSPAKSISSKSKCTSPSNMSSTISPSQNKVSLPGTPKTRRLAVVDSPNSQQMIIDAGQKKIGADQCGVCGMVYTFNLPYDQQQHAVHHKRFLDSVKFSGWKNERVVLGCLNGRILKILPSDPKYALKKVKEIISLVDVDLGFENRLSTNINFSKIVYLFISNKNQVAGCLVAEPVSRAFPLVSDSAHRHTVSTYDDNAVPVVCGVSRLWTYYPYRRQNIASKLVDTVRTTFVLGSQLDKDQIAFSDPTPDGIKFASRYFQSPNFLTYNSTQS